MIDLHCHTNISDNSYTTEEVIKLAKGNGVTHLAITDHDTTKGLELAITLGEKYGVEIIPGIEISAFDYQRNKRAHILGFYVTPGNQAIRSLCDPMLARRHEASYEMVERLIAAGYVISWEQVQDYAKAGTGVYKQHIMHALLDGGYTDRIYGDLYKKLFSRGEGGEPPGIAYLPIEYIDVLDAIAAIKEAGGIPVLAHPGQFDNFAAVPEWVEIGLEGIEVRHPLHEEQEEEQAAKLAEQFRLIKTGGSDFHGFYGEMNVEIGSKSMGIACIEALKQRKAEKKE